MQASGGVPPQRQSLSKTIRRLRCVPPAALRAGTLRPGARVAVPRRGERARRARRAAISEDPKARLIKPGKCAPSALASLRADSAGFWLGQALRYRLSGPSALYRTYVPKRMPSFRDIAARYPRTASLRTITGTAAARSAWLICAFFLLAGVAVLDDYGMASDEIYQRRTAQIILDYVWGRSDALLRYEDRMYGVAVEAPLWWAERALNLQDSRAVYLLRHLLTHLLFLAGGWAAGSWRWARWACSCCTRACTRIPSSIPRTSLSSACSCWRCYCCIGPSAATPGRPSRSAARALGC